MRLIRIFATLAAIAGSAAAVRAESLWRSPGSEPHSMYADRKAAYSGDILTVVVQESVAAQSTQNKESTRKSSLSDAVQQFLYPVAVSGLGSHAGNLPSTQTSGRPPVARLAASAVAAQPARKNAGIASMVSRSP